MPSSTAAESTRRIRHDRLSHRLAAAETIGWVSEAGNLRPSHRSRVTPAVDEHALPGDVARLRRAQEGAHGAEFPGLAVATGGARPGARRPDLLERLPGHRD